MKKGKKRYIILLVILIFIGLNKLYDHVLIQDANKQINLYRKAQGLDKEEILKDTGTHLGEDVYFRKIRYKKNPDETYLYTRTSRVYWNLYYHIPFFGMNQFLEEGKDVYYEGVDFTIQSAMEGEEDPTTKEGRLDIKGKLIQEIPWK